MDYDKGNTKPEHLKFTAVSLNVRGLHDHNKRKKLFQWITDTNIDILFLQETFCDDVLEKKLNREYKNWGHIYTSNPKSHHARGVATLISKNVKFTVENIHRDENGRKLLLNIIINKNKISLLNLYAPCSQSERTHFFTNTQKWMMNKICNMNYVITGGDMNTTVSSLDRINGAIDPCAKYYKTFKISNGLEDAWRYLNPQTQDFTYISSITNKGVSRIDHMLISTSLLSYLSKAEITTAPTPDHKAVMIKIDTTHNTRGKGYWKLNNTHLKNMDYQEGIKQIFNQTRAEYETHTNIHDVWELCKIRFKEYSIKYSIRKKRQLRNITIQIAKDIDKLDKSIIDNQVDGKLIAKRKHLKGEYENLLKQKFEGAKIRARAKWWEEGERSTAYFLNLENKRQANNKITKLIDTAHTIVDTDTEILETAVKYYEQLFTSNSINAEQIKQYLHETHIEKTLTSNEAKLCDGYIETNECQHVIDTLKLNKSPGLDGLTAEFYQTFWPEISELVIKVFNYSYDLKTLTTSQNHSVISLIYKKGDDFDLKNYRPISISNIDYKIMAFVLANRVHKVIHKIINENQTGYIKKRFIGQNIRLIQDMIQHSKGSTNKGVILFLDFEKAFDSIEWNFIFLTLERMKFGNNFISWIKTIYSTPVASIKNNGWNSRKFDIKRGVKQGCPISALLFTIAVEILATRLRQNNQLKGYSVSKYNASRTVKITQYADDTQLFLANDHQIPIALSIIETFSNMAGPKLNLHKTEGIRLGTQARHNENIHGINLKSTPIKCLGIYIGIDSKQCNKLNWNGPIEQMELLLNTWKKRDLTIFGKITIIKTLCLSKINHIIMNCEHEIENITYINRLFYNFLWGKRDRIKRNNLICNIEDGGVNMIDIESHCEVLKAAWVKRIVESENCNWSFLSNLYFKHFGSNYQILKCSFANTNSLPSLSQIPIFYQQVITAFCKSNATKRTETRTDILNQHIWGNRHITYHDKNLKRECSIYFTHFIEKGIERVGDLKFTNGIINEYYIYDTVTHKNNILIEIALLRKTLRKYKHIIGTHSPVRNMARIQTYKHDMPNNKTTYRLLVEQKSCKSQALTKWTNIIGAPTQISSLIYTNKIKIKNKKLAEFNYKVINNILACKLNLYKWKLTQDSNCDICGEAQNILHLLYLCQNAKQVWNYVEKHLNISITQKSIIYGIQNENIKTYIISLISFLIYKEWIICNNNQTSRTTDTLQSFVLPELTERQKLYKYIKEIDISTEIDRLL